MNWRGLLTMSDKEFVLYRRKTSFNSKGTVGILTRKYKRSKKKSTNKRKSKWKIVIAFLIFEIIFCLVTGPLLLMFGPFENVKRIFVGTFWNTFSHQYVVKAFLSDEAINRVVTNGMAKPIDGITHSDSDLVQLADEHSDNIEVYSIKSASVEGKLMVVHDPKRVILAYSFDMPESGKTTSEIVRDFEGIAGINAGGFKDDWNFAGNGGVAGGYIIHNGEIIIDNLYDEGLPTGDHYVGIDFDGKLFVGYKYQSPDTWEWVDGTLSHVLAHNPKEAVNFGPPLIINGQKQITYGDGGLGVAPRTAIGQRKTGEILLLVMDGRSGRTIGVTGKEMQDILHEHGAYNAANLDGGASTTMVYKNKVINVPSNNMGERSIPSAFVILPPIDYEGTAE